MSFTTLEKNSGVSRCGMNLVSQSSFDLHNNRVTPYDWRFMKYEWIETEAYSNGKNLVEYVKKVLKEFGTKYIINFA